MFRAIALAAVLTLTVVAILQLAPPHRTALGPTPTSPASGHTTPTAAPVQPSASATPVTRTTPATSVRPSATPVPTAQPTATPAPSATPAPAPAGLALRVSGNHLVNASGQTIRLLGVDRSSTVYACIQGWGLLEGPTDAASVAAIASWHANAVRLQLNEDCWLNINMGGSAYGGAPYQSTITNYVKLLHQRGLYVVLSLAWNAPGASQARDQQVMADADHAPAFWSSVATAFKSDPAVAFDLYNEPHDISWACWLNGCTTSGGWQAAGMQSLVNAVRSTGARQPLLLGGNGWASDLSQWLQYKPNDPANALVASFHVYGPSFSQCTTTSCLNSTVAPVAQHVPVVTGEMGENDCTHGYIDVFMPWADSLGISYLGFTWDAWPNKCASGPTMILDYSGTPTNYGVGFKNHLLAIVP